jgi:hypothetical protein
VTVDFEQAGKQALDTRSIRLDVVDEGEVE